MSVQSLVNQTEGKALPAIVIDGRVVSQGPAGKTVVVGYDVSPPASEDSTMAHEEPSTKQHFTTQQAREVGDTLGIDWSRFDVEQFRMGMNVELEHGLRDPATDVTGDDTVLTGKIALAHLNEFPDYYTRLAKMEREAKEEWGLRKAAR